MSFFEKRPLSIILCILLGGFSLFTLFPTVLRFIALALAALALILFIILIKRMGCFPVISIVAMLVSFALSFVYFDLYFPIYNRITGPAIIEGQVTDIIYNESFGALVTVKTKSINHQAFSKSKILVSYVPEHDSDFSLDISDKVMLYGEIKELENSEFGFDEKSYYEAKGIQGIVKEVNAITFTKNTRFSFRRWLSDARETIFDYIMRSSDVETSGFLAALLLGDKSELPGQLRLDFKRIGLSHVLAISGMHLAILSAGLHKFLTVLHLDKKWRCLISMFFIAVYMGITGFSISILRAGIMLMIANLLFLLAKTKDSFTNLMISVTVICLISPYALRDISLLLSFFATLGVLIAIDILEDIPYYTAWWLKCLIAILASILSSFFAIAMTLPFSVFDFGRISYLAPIATLIFTFLIEIFMYVGGIFLLIGAPKFLSLPVNWLANLISDLAAFFADFRNVYMIADTLAIKVVCVVFYTLFLLFLILRIEHRKIALSILLIPFLAIFALGYLTTEKTLESDRILYFSDTEQNDAILVIQGETVTVANFTNNSLLGRGYLLYLLEQEDILALDFLWIPQYTANLPKALSNILSTVPVRHIYLPKPQDEEEEYAYIAAKETIKNFRCHFSKYENFETIAVKDAEFYPVYRAPMDEGCRVMFSVQLHEQYYTYISNGAIEPKTADIANYIMVRSRAVIFGCRGRTYRETYYIEESSPHTDTLIFATDKIEIAQNVYEDYKDRARLLYKPKRVELFISPE